jgi:hypothetical protein
MTTERAELPLPAFASWPIFPFVGDMRVRAVEPRQPADWPRAGEPGGGPCKSCEESDDRCIWVDDHWRVLAPHERSAVPVQLFLETREHVDMDGLLPERAAELGQLIVRLDRAIQAIGGIGRVHMSRWGDGASHFHLWFYARPLGDIQMLGFCLPMWALILPPTADDIWNRNLAIVAGELARDGGRAILGSD